MPAFLLHPPICLSKKPSSPPPKTFTNRQAHHRYNLLQTHQCGIELLGTEIKSIRAGTLQLRDAYAQVTRDHQLYLHNAHIPPFNHASPTFNHDPLRPRRLLLHKHLIRSLATLSVHPGYTLIPVRAYFAKNGFFKVDIALAQGKKLHDKREDIKRRDQDRELRAVIKASVTRLN